MKPRLLVLLSGTLTLGFGYWLAEGSRDSREIWVALAAWILGFWFASSIMGLGGADGQSNDAQANDFGEAEWEEE